MSEENNTNQIATETVTTETVTTETVAVTESAPKKKSKYSIDDLPSKHRYFPMGNGGHSFLSVLFDIFGGLGVGFGFIMFLATLATISEIDELFDVGPAAYFTAFGPLLLTSFFSCFMFAIAYALRKLKVISIATEEMEATARETAAINRLIAKKLLEDAE